MMNGTEHKFAVGDRVKLRGEVDPGFYDGMAKTGNEGWIGGRRRDNFGLPEVFIRWDPNHWAYNRQPNRWTFQDHFDLVEEKRPMSDKSQITDELLTKFAEFLATQAPKERAPADRSPVADIEPSEDERVPDFAKLAQKVADVIPGAEAFMCIAVIRKADDRAPQGALVSEVIGDSLTPEAESLLGAQLSTFGAQFHRTSAVLNIQSLAEGYERRENPDDNG